MVIEVTSGRNWASDVIDATDGLGADWGVNIAGGGTFEPFVAALRPAGRLILVGVRAGVVVEISPAFMTWGLNIHSTRIGSRSDFEQMNRAIAAAKLKPAISKVFRFGEVPEAFAFFAEARHVRKVAITID